jgi:hypothetical protein
MESLGSSATSAAHYEPGQASWPDARRRADSQRGLTWTACCGAGDCGERNASHPHWLVRRPAKQATA